ncbi:MAG: hypothetical protein DBY43_07190 [Clostridiaceae bacterium]|nr:MAG: hypothetical protein DBY43_07190 [Clostridiaceae bacterium]
MGLLAADGHCQKYISKRGDCSYRIKIEQAEEQVLKDIGEFYQIPLKYRERIIANKNRSFWSLSFPVTTDKLLGNYLNTYRADIDLFFKSLSNEEQNNFMRGYFDGDGSIVFTPQGLSKQGYMKYRYTMGFSINSKQQSLLRILNFWREKYNFTLSKYLDKRGNGTWYYSINNYKNLQTIFDLFYSNAPVFKNERKYIVFNNLCETMKEQYKNNEFLFS